MSQSSIDQLFCTPEQGTRLKELVPELTSVFVWYRMHDDYKVSANNMIHRHLYPPALTLQELRDVATVDDLFEHDPDTGYLYGWPEMTATMTAPELAAWVIERLEEVV